VKGEEIMATKAEIQRNALDRAVNQNSISNYPQIYDGFMERGYEEEDILPRENIFTYDAWQALGRQVRKGEKGVRINTIRIFKDKKDPEKTYSRPWRSYVFHINQTDPIE